MHDFMHGMMRRTNRRTMGDCRITYSRVAAPRGRAQQAVAREPRSDERYSLDFAQWRPMEGFTRPALCHTRPAIVDSSRGSRMARSGSVLEALAEDLYERGELDLSECFIDGTFVAAKKRSRRGKTAGQGYEAHRGGRPRWSSFRH